MANKFVFNPLTGEFDYILNTFSTSFQANQVIVTGKVITLDLISNDLTIASGYSLVHANTAINDGVIVTVEGGLVVL